MTVGAIGIAVVSGSAVVGGRVGSGGGEESRRRVGGARDDLPKQAITGSSSKELHFLKSDCKQVSCHALYCRRINESPDAR